MTKQKRKYERFFTIATPRKDGAILDKFLDEFGYSAFEKEDRHEDTRRSVQQISSNDELIEEIADFCKDNTCVMQLIYKRGHQLVQQSFKSDKTFQPKPYGNNEGEKLEELSKKPKQKKSQNNTDVNSFLDSKQKELNKSKNPRNRNNNNKRRNPRFNKPEKELKQVSDTPVQNQSTQNVSDVKVIKKKRKFTKQ